jgi:hypothetical protein
VSWLLCVSPSTTQADPHLTSDAFSAQIDILIAIIIAIVVVIITGDVVVGCCGAAKCIRILLSIHIYNATSLANNKVVSFLILRCHFSVFWLGRTTLFKRVPLAA